MFVIVMSRRYFNARGGYCGRWGPKKEATLFTEQDARDRSNNTPGSTVESL